MSIYKDDKKGTWYSMIRYNNWKGERVQKMKRGFATKREASAWEISFQQEQTSDLDMTFEVFVGLYERDCKDRLRLSTWRSKEVIIRTKLMPYFKTKKMSEIKATDIIQWQNVLLQYKDEKGAPYSPTYLKTIHNQISAIFNHASKFYDLKDNPARKAGNMGKEQSKEMLFWTKEEYLKFSESMMDKTISFHAFEILYWCGIRLGELLALTPADFDFTRKTVSINKSYQRLEGKDYITDPKTKKSKRFIQLSDFLCEEIREFIKMNYGIKQKDRLFNISKSILHNEMTRGAKEQGLQRIRIHDLRHSHVSLLIDMGFSALAIADRVGHESVRKRRKSCFPAGAPTQFAARSDETVRVGHTLNISG